MTPPDASRTTCPCCGARNARRRFRLSTFDVYDCAGCTLRFRDPLPEPESLQPMYEHESYLNGAYFENTGPGYRRDTPEIRIYSLALAALARSVPKGRLLDVGCGPGVFLDLAREDGWDVRGVEISGPHVAHARKAFGLDVWQGDFLSEPSAEGTYTAVTMWDFLEHVLDPVAVLARARRLLAPDGALVVFTIDSTSLINRVGSVLHALSLGTITRPVELLYDEHHNWFFTPQSLERLIRSQGFEIESWQGHRAHLGRWANQPAPAHILYGGMLLDVASFAVGLPYRRTLLCRPSGAVAA